eukprot:TRINITY_DN11403_c0_g1_i2.p2 TRINITY_DN11403_c0_g1~~TRINITY_DN11403_c0_g1_i2.p2  ORF type:complete len:101 (+),score=18.13 TRINITY_DN11403_c0_g1_i2:23-304(+)
MEGVDAHSALPPLELRVIIDKTAVFVARNGPAFEACVREKQGNTERFGFLESGSPYHAYYEAQVAAAKLAAATEKMAVSPPQTDASTVPSTVE